MVERGGGGFLHFVPGLRIGSNDVPAKSFCLIGLQEDPKGSGTTNQALRENCAAILLRFLGCSSAGVESALGGRADSWQTATMTGG